MSTRSYPVNHLVSYLKAMPFVKIFYNAIRPFRNVRNIVLVIIAETFE